MRRLALAFAFLVAICLVASGCNSRTSAGGDVRTYPVRGTVRYNGQPIGGARVTLHPLPAERFAGNPFAVTNPDGTFEVTTFRPNDGAPLGDFAVTVSWAPSRNPNVSEPDDGPERLPKKYQKADQLGLRVAVEPQENLLAAFELKK